MEMFLLYPIILIVVTVVVSGIGVAVVWYREKNRAVIHSILSRDAIDFINELQRDIYKENHDDTDY